MAEQKNIDFDRPGGYAMPIGATRVQRRAARHVAQADIRLYGDAVAAHQPSSIAEPLRPNYQASSPDTRLYVGDCRDLVARLPDRGEVDLVFADPPFNWDVPYDEWHDGMPRAEYERFTFDWLDACVEALAPRGGKSRESYHAVTRWLPFTTAMSIPTSTTASATEFTRSIPITKTAVTTGRQSVRGHGA